MAAWRLAYRAGAHGHMRLLALSSLRLLGTTTVTEGYVLNSVPPELRRTILKDAKKRDTSVTNVVGEILATRYRLRYEPSTRSSTDVQKADYLFVRLPSTVMHKIRGEKRTTGVTMRSIMLHALSLHYGLEPPEYTKAVNSGRPSGEHWRHGRPKGRKARK